MSTSSVYSKNQIMTTVSRIEKAASGQYIVNRVAQPVINMAGRAAACSPNLAPAPKPIKKRTSATFMIPTAASSTNVPGHTSISVSRLTPAWKPMEKRPILPVPIFPITTQTITTTEDTYEGEIANGCRHGLGTNIYANGDKYEGQWKNGQRQGQGTHTFADGGKYEGEWRNDMQHGQGTHTFASGNKYEGQWKNGERQGQGTYTYVNGDKYEGQWENDKMQGQGTYTFACGEKYEGQWHNGERQGKGTYTLTCGEKYEGQWQNNTLLLPNKCSKPASVKSNTPPAAEQRSHNLRSRSQRSGNKKTGQSQDTSVRDHQKIDWGTPVYLSPDDPSDPVFFESAILPTALPTTTTAAPTVEYRDSYGVNKLVFKPRPKPSINQKPDDDQQPEKPANRKPEGQRSHIYANGSRYVGQWERDIPNGKGTLTFVNGDQYEGEWLNGLAHGQGRMLVKGNRYEGSLKNGKLDGQGTCHYANGNKYEGQWENGKAHGQGTMTFANGTKYEGRWENGTPVNEEGGHNLRVKRSLSQTPEESQYPAEKRVRRN